MISLLTSVVDFLTSIGKFIVNSITSTFNFIQHIPTYFDFLNTSIAFMPTIFMPFIRAFLSISIVLFVIGLIL